MHSFYCACRRPRLAALEAHDGERMAASSGVFSAARLPIRAVTSMHTGWQLLAGGYRRKREGNIHFFTACGAACARHWPFSPTGWHPKGAGSSAPGIARGEWDHDIEALKGRNKMGGRCFALAGLGGFCRPFPRAMPWADESRPLWG